MVRRTHSILFLLCAAVLLLGACKGIKPEASYPTRIEGTDKIIYSDQKVETIWGDDEGSLGKKLFGGEDENVGSGGIGVNSFLWRASLDTLAFIPIASADPFGGVIITDWYENPETPGERFKLNVYILDKLLRADGIRVAVFKQKMDNNTWRDATVADSMALTIENTILTRARELRITQMGGGQN